MEIKTRLLVIQDQIEIYLSNRKVIWYMTLSNSNNFLALQASLHAVQGDPKLRVLPPALRGRGLGQVGQDRLQPHQRR